MAHDKPLSKTCFEICVDHAEHGPFEPCGSVYDDLREAVRELKREQKRRPWAYIAKHEVTRLSAIEVARLELQLKRKKKG